MRKKYEKNIKGLKKNKPGKDDYLKIRHKYRTKYENKKQRGINKETKKKTAVTEEIKIEQWRKHGIARRK